MRKIVPLKWGWNKVHRKGEDLIIVVCGPTGKGKTTLSTQLAEDLDVTFKGKSRFPYLTSDFNQEGFDFKEPLKTINHTNFDKVVPRFCFGANQTSEYWTWLKKRTEQGMATKGIVGVVDEIQTLWSAREYYSKKNKKAITQFVTGRYLGTIHILIGPEYTAIDKQILRRVHMVIQVLDKMVDSRTGKPCIAWTAHLPVFLDPTKPPILRYFRDRSGVIQDKPFYSPMPSDLLYKLVRAKELFWKNAEKDDWGNLIDPSKIAETDLSSGEKKAKQIEEMANGVKHFRHMFVVERAGKKKYSKEKVSLHFPAMSKGWADFFIPHFEKWDQEEKLDLQALVLQKG